MRVSSASGEWFEREMISLSTCLGHEVGDENGVFFLFSNSEFSTPLNPKLKSRH